MFTLGFIFPVVSVPAWILLGIWFALQAVEGVLSFRHPDVGVAFFAHVGGFVTGMGLGFVLARRPRRRAPRRSLRCKLAATRLQHDRRLSHPHGPVPPRRGRAARVRRARHRPRHVRDGFRRSPAVPRRLDASSTTSPTTGPWAWTSSTTTSRGCRPLRASTPRDLRILVGIEADYIEETLDETAEVLASYPFDYVIGSVHIVGERFAFDHPEMREHLSGVRLRAHLPREPRAGGARGRKRPLRRHRAPRPREEARPSAARRQRP